MALFKSLIVVVVVLAVPDRAERRQVDDWTSGCVATGCKCKWISGKRTADCRASGLSGLPNFTSPDAIQVLHLDHNPLREVGERAFYAVGMINLQKVYLSNCSIASVDPSAFDRLVLLIELDLSRNQVAGLKDGTFNGNFRIRKLWLSHNPMLGRRSLQGFTFPPIAHLRLLDLSHCRLAKLNRSTFTMLPDLEVLRLNDNRFKRIDKSVFTPIRGLKSLTLEGNPWNCDCRLQDFWQWLMANQLFNLPTACERPKKLHGEMI